MEIVIKGAPELRSWQARVATAVRFKNPEAEAKARREYTRQRGLLLIRAGEELLASVEGADVQ